MTFSLRRCVAVSCALALATIAACTDDTSSTTDTPSGDAGLGDAHAATDSGGGAVDSGGRSEAGSDAGSDGSSEAGVCLDSRTPAGDRITGGTMKLTRLWLDTATGSAAGSASSSSAWKKLGFNIDGLCSSRSSTDHCQLRSGASASVKEDGEGGTDNSFGANVLPILTNADADFTTNADLGRSYLTVESSGNGVLALPCKSGQACSWHIPLTHLVATGTISGSHVIGGTLSAVIPVEPLVTGFREYLGIISSNLCGSTSDTVAGEIRKAVDLTDNATQSATAPCTTISIGLAFEADPAAPGDVPAAADGCP